MNHDNEVSNMETFDKALTGLKASALKLSTASDDNNHLIGEQLRHSIFEIQEGVDKLLINAKRCRSSKISFP